MSDSQSPLEPEFITLLTRHERMLSVYVHSLVSATSDAEDILQLTKLQMWHLFDRFEQGTNFLAWARKIAFYQMLNYRRAEETRHLSVEPEILESLACSVAELSSPENPRREALEKCLAKLPMDHRRLITLRYFEDQDIPDLSKRIGSTVGAVYRSLSRIRINLLACIEEELSQTETAPQS